MLTDALAAGGAEAARAFQAMMTMHKIDVDFPIWEMHPMGEEIICLLAGKMTITLDIDGEQSRHLLDEPGAFVRVPKGAWHT